MNYRDLTPYAILPNPRRPIRLNPGGFAEAYAAEGVAGLATVIRDALRPCVTGRASTPAEVRLLREWLDVATVEEVARWLRRHAAPEPPEDPVARYFEPGEKTPEEVEAIRRRVSLAQQRRMAKGEVFRECPECSSWFAPQRVRPSADGRVYCSPRCRGRARRASPEAPDRPPQHADQPEKSSTRDE